MAFFEIDASKCRHDGICVAECPAFLLEMKTKDSPPTPIAGADKRCFRCGHCVAVCPHGAISIEPMPSDSLPMVQKELMLSPEQAEHFLRYRRSIRNYKEEPVEREKLERLMDLARYGPTGTNSQMVSWIVLSERQRVVDVTRHAVDWMRDMVAKKVPFAEQYNMAGIAAAWDAGMDIICRGAPAVVVTHMPASYPLAQVDSSIQLTYLDLAAPTLGLGTCWAGFFMIAASQWAPMREALMLPEGRSVAGAMMVGYPKYKYYRFPRRNEPQITWL